MSYSTRFVARRVDELHAEKAHFEKKAAEVMKWLEIHQRNRKEKQEAYELLELCADIKADRKEENGIARLYNRAVKRVEESQKALARLGGQRALARHRRAVKAIKAEIEEVAVTDRRATSGLTQKPFAGLWAAFPSASPAK